MPILVFSWKLLHYFAMHRSCCHIFPFIYVFFCCSSFITTKKESFSFFSYWFPWPSQTQFVQSCLPHKIDSIYEHFTSYHFNVLIYSAHSISHRIFFSISLRARKFNWTCVYVCGQCCGSNKCLSFDMI